MNDLIKKIIGDNEQKGNDMAALDKAKTIIDDFTAKVTVAVDAALELSDESQEKANPHESELRLIFAELSKQVADSLSLSEELHIVGFPLMSVAITQVECDGKLERTKFELNATPEVLSAMAALKTLPAEQGEKSFKALVDGCIVKTTDIF